MIRRALAAGYPLRSALVTPRWLTSLRSDLADAEAPIYVGSDAVLQAVTGFHVHRGALAAMQRLPLPPARDVLAGARRLVVLEDIVNHTNLGAILRSAGALGMDGALLTPSCADPLYRRSVRVSMGGVFSLPWARLARWPGDVALVRDAGFAVWALTPAVDADDIRTAAASLSASDGRVALVLGTEGDGLSPGTVRTADRRVRIPMARGVDSLNVAAAAAVAFFALGG